MKKILVALLAAGAVLMHGTVSMAKVDWAKAQKQPQKQTQSSTMLAGAALTNGGNSDFGVGARIEYPLDSLMSNLSIVGSFNYFFPGSNQTWWELNANAIYSIRVNDTFTPYVGAGINYASWKVNEVNPWYFYGDYYGGVYYRDGYYGRYNYSVADTAVSLNVIGGCKINLNMGLTPFIEARVGVGDNKQLEITAGALFGF